MYIMPATRSDTVSHGAIIHTEVLTAPGLLFLSSISLSGIFKSKLEWSSAPFLFISCRSRIGYEYEYEPETNAV